MACVYTYVHTYICIHYQVYVRASQTHASRQLPPGLSDTRVHQASSIKARARESDRALDGAAADFDPSRRPPEPHFAFPHAPLLPSTRAQPGRATQTSRLSQVGPSASCIASPRFLAHRSAPACPAAAANSRSAPRIPFTHQHLYQHRSALFCCRRDSRQTTPPSISSSAPRLLRHAQSVLESRRILAPGTTRARHLATNHLRTPRLPFRVKGHHLSIPEHT
jgi:hypothetical protein